MTRLTDDDPDDRLGTFWTPPSALGLEEPSLLREPPRLATVVGCATLIVTALLPHADGVSRNAFHESVALIPDSGILFLFAAGLIVLVTHRAIAESRMGTLRVLPFVLAVGCGSTWLNILRLSQQAIREWTGAGGGGQLTVPFLLGGVASVVVLGATVWLLAADRPRSVAKDPDDRVVLQPVVVVRSIAGVIGTVAGAVAGLAAVVTVVPSSVFIVPLLGVFGAFYGAMAGSWIGAAVGRRLASRWPNEANGNRPSLR